MSIPSLWTKPDLDQTRRFLSYLLDPAIGCCELRILHATFDRSGFIVSSQQYSRTLTGWYDDPAKFVADASRLRGISGYITINPVQSVLLARSDNQLTKAKHTTSDADITCLRWFYVDIDPIRPADVSSTDDELAAAVDVRDRLLGDLPDIRATAMWGRSGNGCWILVRMIDRVNNQENAGILKQILGRLSEYYLNEQIRIDQSTFNPARIMCIPGLIKCKGSNRTERPWRMTTFDGVGDILAGGVELGPVRDNGGDLGVAV